MKLVKQRLIQCQMKLEQPRESHPFGWIARRLFEIEGQLKNQKKLKVLQGQ